MKVSSRLSGGPYPPHARAASPHHWMPMPLGRRLLPGLRVLLLVVAVLVAAAGIRAPQTAHAAEPGLPANGAAPPLDFHGGYVQYHPKVYLVFWGPKWSSDPAHKSIISQVQQTFYTLAGSDYNNILTQYNNQSSDPNGHVHNDVELIDTWVDDTSTPPDGLFIGVENLSGGEIKDEATKAFQSYWRLQPDRNIQIIVFPQQGSTYRKFAGIDLTGGACGMHSYAPESTYQLAYGWVRYASDGACDFTGDLAQNMAWTAVHEYAEMATDPHIWWDGAHVVGSGWYSDNAFHQLLNYTFPVKEVADLCENWYVDVGNSSPYYHTPSGPNVYSVTFTVPYLWSNWSYNYDAGNGCVMAEGQDYWSPDNLLPYSNKHTVQGGILNKYQGTCSEGSTTGTCSDWLGAPVSEETNIANGAVSYFASGSSGTSCTKGPHNSCSAIYWSPDNGSHYVWGGIYTRYWQDFGEAAGSLSFPSSDETTIAGGAASYFAGGTSGTSCSKGPHNSCSAMYWSSSTGIHVVWGGIYYRYWHDFGEAAGAFGFPTSDETLIAGGAASYFAGGSSGTSCTKGPYNSCSAFYWSSATGTHYVWGGIYYRFWHDFGGPSGFLGFPVSDETLIAGGAASYFYKAPACGGNHPYGSSGALYWSSSTGTHEVHGCIYNQYVVNGGPTSLLGFPTSDEYGITNGRRSDFEHGYIWYDNSTGLTHTVVDCDVTGKCV